VFALSPVDAPSAPFSVPTPTQGPRFVARHRRTTTYWETQPSPPDGRAEYGAAENPRETERGDDDAEHAQSWV
jgi:hypothetical protein